MIAAETRELTALAAKLAGRRRVSGTAAVAYAETGEYGGRRWIAAANGPGPRLASQAVCALAAEMPNRVGSTGYCGALDPALKIADIVVCNRVVDADSDHRYRAADEFGATCLSGDRVIQTAREKQYLRETTGASVVEMEAAGVAVEAGRLGVPFHCIRVVTDTAHEDLAVDFNAARGEDGRFRAGAIVRAAFRSPGKALPQLVRLGGRARAATARLGDYLVTHPF